MKQSSIINRVMWIIFGIMLFIGACIFPYPALFMSNSLPRQPELSKNEVRYFEQLKKEHLWSDISRMYINVDSLGQDVMIKNKPVDFSTKYRYSAEFLTKDSLLYYAHNTLESAVEFAKYIKDSICIESYYLVEIRIIITYKDTIEDSRNGMFEFYQFKIIKNSLYLVPQGY